MLAGGLAPAQATPQTPTCTRARPATAVATAVASDPRRKPCRGKRRRHRGIGQGVALTPPLPEPVGNSPTVAEDIAASPIASQPPPAEPPPTEEPPTEEEPPAEEEPPSEEEEPPSEEEPPAEEEEPVEEEPWEQPAEEPPSSCTDTVTTLSEAVSAVSAAEDSAVICLADGSYGKANLSASPGGRVTMRAEHPGEATISGASLDGQNLTLERFTVDGEVEIQPGANGMTVAHNRIIGGGEGINGCPSTTVTCDDMKIVGNELIGPFGEDAIHLNRYHDGDGDGVGVLVEGNEITGVRENGSHSDCLQTVWVGDHIVFRRNYLHNNRCQGFFIKDQASPVIGITIEDNLFLRNKEPCGPPLTECGQPNYFQVFGPYEGLTMERNTIWGNGSESIAAFREGTSPDTVISKNVIYRLWTDTEMSGVTLSENTLCKREGSWPSSQPGETIACILSFVNTAQDDYRLSGSDRGVDWAPAEVHFGP